MVRGIRPYVTGRIIRSVATCANTCKPISIVPGFRRLQRVLLGKTFRAVRRLGKRVVFDVSDGSNLVIEPRMTGLMVLSDPPDVEHLRLRWDFEGLGEFGSLWFWDRRGLGTVRLFSVGTLDEHFDSTKLGPDAMEMTPATWAERCARTGRAIKVMLLDQKVVAGIGNLYASEILHVASIDPTAAANSLNSSALSRLAASVQSVLATAIDYEGSTLGDGTHRNALNQSGRYQNEHRAYMREGQACLACQKGEIIRIIQAQRSTFYCPRCQQTRRPSR
jgi:formamidopyrimidine-DNA glycosylase